MRSYDDYFKLLDEETKDIIRVYEQYRKVYEEHKPIVENMKSPFSTTQNIVLGSLNAQFTTSFVVRM